MATSTDRNTPRGSLPSSALCQLLVFSLRLTLGALVVYQGEQKLAGGVRGFQVLIESHGIPLPSLTAWSVTVLELAGGGLMIFGLLTRVWALLLSAEMTLFALVVRLDGGLVYSAANADNLGLLCLSSSLILLLLGPGRWSIDRVLGLEPLRRWPKASPPRGVRRFSRPRWDCEGRPVRLGVTLAKPCPGLVPAPSSARRWARQRHPPHR